MSLVLFRFSQDTFLSSFFFFPLLFHVFKFNLSWILI